MSNNAHDLSNRLLNALDNNYNVVDMPTVNEIISILERLNITKELLETTRLGKHVNELRRKTADPTLARRAKVLVKRWRDLVIPTRASPQHTGSNSTSAERQIRRLGGTPLTSPALSRQVVSPAVPSPRPPSRPAWGGYESDSNDVILVDDDPPPPPPPPAAAAPAPAPATPVAPASVPGPSGEGTSGWKPLTPVKRPPSPQTVHDEKKSKRDKKPKKRRGHSRAGTDTTTPAPASPAASPAAAPPPAPAPSAAPAAAPPAPPAPPAAPAAPAGWHARNGASHERRRNGCRRDAIDKYTALVNNLSTAGTKKNKTTQELLEQIQSRGNKPTPASDHDDDDVVVVEDTDVYPTKVSSPLRNGGAESPPPPRASPPPPAAPRPVTPPPLPPLEDEREYADCTCGDEEADESCPAALRTEVLPFHIRALHNAYLPGVNGTRAPTHPHQFAVRKLTDPEKPELFTSVVPLYKYSDYADDYCVKNMARVPLCTRLPWTEFAPPPPELPPPPSPPPLRPYPIEPSEKAINEDMDSDEDGEVKTEKTVKSEYKCVIEPEIMSLPNLEQSERLKAPLLLTEDVKNFDTSVVPTPMEVSEEFKLEQRDHRTVERTKVDIDGRTLYAMCEHAIESVPFVYSQTATAPVVTLPQDCEAPTVLEAALEAVASDREVDTLGRPPRPDNFTEWHECAKLGDLIALPYVVID